MNKKEPPSLSNIYTPCGRIDWELKFYFADAIFPHFVWEKYLTGIIFNSFFYG
jgi:hypothetical protein